MSNIWQNTQIEIINKETGKTLSDVSYDLHCEYSIDNWRFNSIDIHNMFVHIDDYVFRNKDSRLDYLNRRLEFIQKHNFKFFFRQYEESKEDLHNHLYQMFNLKILYAKTLKRESYIIKNVEKLNIYNIDDLGSLPNYHCVVGTFYTEQLRKLIKDSGLQNDVDQCFGGVLFKTQAAFDYIRLIDSNLTEDTKVMYYSDTNDLIQKVVDNHTKVKIAFQEGIIL